MTMERMLERERCQHDRQTGRDGPILSLPQSATGQLDLSEADLREAVLAHYLAFPAEVL